VSELPPEDRPDTLDIGPVRGIPIHYDDDPRLDADRALWSAANKKAQVMHSADELLHGLGDEDWRVRHQVIDRLAARGKDDPRTIEALARTLRDDPQWEVRDAAALAIHWFRTPLAVEALRQALTDPHEEVRQSAEHGLAQLGEG
jgi:HEAT repeat protein